MLLRRYTGEIVEGHPLVDGILWYDDGEGRERGFITIVHELRDGRFDAAVLVHPTPRLAFLIACAGIPLRVGTGYRYYAVLFNRRVYEHRRHGTKHELEHNLALLGPLGCGADPPGADPDYLISLNDRDRQGARVVLERRGIPLNEIIIVMHPGSGGSARDWPARSFGLLAARLADLPGVRVVITGSAGESTLAAEVVRASEGRACSVAGELRLRELGALLAGSSLVIANSTGPLHLAAALGTPVLGLYPQLPAIGPGRWGPFASRSRVLVPDGPPDCRVCAPAGGRPCPCMESIAVDRVAAEAVKMLERFPKAVEGTA
jgi:ADP-heptose:LPS heptosyltransferase